MFWKYAANLQENTHAEVRFQSNFIEITLRHGCSPVNLLHIFRTAFLKNTNEWLLPYIFLLSSLLWEVFIFSNAMFSMSVTETYQSVRLQNWNDNKYHATFIYPFSYFIPYYYWIFILPNFLWGGNTKVIWNSQKQPPEVFYKNRCS